MTADLGEWDGDQAGIEEPVVIDVAAGAPNRLFYANVAEFVADFLAPMYSRPAKTWCPEWWRHAEGIYRLEAVWRSWEYLRLEPNTGASVWLLNHADPHMAVLLSGDGPFKGCSADGGHKARAKALPVALPPHGMFGDERAL